MLILIPVFWCLTWSHPRRHSRNVMLQRGRPLTSGPILSVNINVFFVNYWMTVKTTAINFCDINQLKAHMLCSVLHFMPIDPFVMLRIRLLSQTRLIKCHIKWGSWGEGGLVNGSKQEEQPAEATKKSLPVVSLMEWRALFFHITSEMKIIPPPANLIYLLITSGWLLSLIKKKYEAFSLWTLIIPEPVNYSCFLTLQYRWIAQNTTLKSLIHREKVQSKAGPSRV